VKTKIEEDFYPLTASTSRKLREANLTAAEWRFWAFLTEIDPWGDRYKELTPIQIMTECGMSKPTYYRAKAKFQELGLFDFQEEKISFRNLTGVSKMRFESQKSNSNLKNETENSKMRLESQKRENELLESSPCKVSKIPQTLQTYSDLLKTLSEGMRESFEKFCLKKIEECSFKIGSRKAWLNKHGDEYLEEFRQLYSEALDNPGAIAPKAEIAPPDIDTLKRLYGSAGWEAAAIHYGLISPNSLTVENEEEIW
jgi:hypothetical protein